MSNAWIFGCNPQKYDLAGEIRAGQIEVGTEDSWQANQRRREMQLGDTVYHWMTGKQAGIYAVSTLTSEPYEDENPRWPDHKWWVDLRFDRVLEQHRPKADLEKHPVLKELTILRMPRLTNYSLAPGQAEVLRQLVDGETAMETETALSQRRIWKISAGQGGFAWPEFREHSIVGIGYAKVKVEPTRFASFDEMKSEAQRATQDRPSHGAIEQVWVFGHEMKIDDTVIAYGGGTVLGIGKIMGEYAHNPTEDFPLGRMRKVSWTDLTPRPTSSFSADLRTVLTRRRTIVELTEEHLAEISGYQTPIESARSMAIPSLASFLSVNGFHFPQHLLATYLLSLQTKPFVILTGISGTGKTKLAQLFAEWMSPAVEVQTIIKDTPEDDVDSFYLEVHPSYLQGGFVVPKRAYRYFDVPDLNHTIKIMVELGDTGEAIECSLRNQGSGRGGFVYFSHRKGVREWLNESFQAGDILQFERVEEGIRYRLTKFTPVERRVMKRTPRLAFVSVRPDWTENRGLLGFYNLITGAYQTTNFLRLLIQAARDLSVPHFVLLDEMNLAKVEYYFADFLSVLESRYRQGVELKQASLHLHDVPRCVLVQGESLWEEESEDSDQFVCTVRCNTCPLRAGVDEGQWLRGQSDYEDAHKAGFDSTRYVPPRLFVPSNVYFSGTVNVDETTYMFSPKVLDRANTIEFNEVDLASYFSQPEAEDAAQVADDRIRQAFTFGDEFIRLPKDVPLRTDPNLAPYRDRLITLVNLLRPYNMHFGYRVVDEVLLYLWNAEALADPSFGLDTAFDHQLCQKILPKFHGSQAKLQEPLERLLLFCDDPLWRPPEAGSEQVGSDRERISELKEKSTDQLRSARVRYPRAAHKIRRMLDALEKEGFASFA